MFMISFIARPYYRPHYASCSSVHLSIRVSTTPNSNTKRHRKTKISAYI